jgi:hypothetical protein
MTLQPNCKNTKAFWAKNTQNAHHRLVLPRKNTAAAALPKKTAYFCKLTAVGFWRLASGKSTRQPSPKANG